MNHLGLFAREELVLALRSRWTQIFAAVFGVLAFGVAGAGYVLSGGHGVQDFARTPCPSSSSCSCSCRSPRSSSGPVPRSRTRRRRARLLAARVRRTILLGKLLGLFQALAAAQAVGFGAAGAVVYARSARGPRRLPAARAASLVTTAVFLGLAALLSAGAVGRKRTRALALALVVWFVAVVLFDLAALGSPPCCPPAPLRASSWSRRSSTHWARCARGRSSASRARAPSAPPPSRSSASRRGPGRRPRPRALAPLLARGPDGPRRPPPAEGGCLGLPARPRRPSASPSSSAGSRSPFSASCPPTSPRLSAAAGAAAAARARRPTTAAAGPACACAAAAASPTRP